MEVQPDFRDLLASLNAHRVEYAIVGAYALAYHGHPRATGDLDILVQPDLENARRLLQAIRSFGFGDLELTEEDFLEPNRILQLGYPPVRIDLMSGLSGVTWEEVAPGREEEEYGGLPVLVIGREAFIRNKRASGRLQDRADLEALGEVP